jgi:predicted metal-binding protein
LEYLYTTGNGKTYPIEMDYKFIESKNYVYDYDQITSLCEGCGNYHQGGGCPPLAPKFDDIIKTKRYSIMIYAKLLSKYKSEGVKNSNNYYIHYRFQDIILSNLLTNLGYTIRDDYNNLVFLNNGFCMGCSKKCSFKLGENICRNPKKRTFSLEATGVNVEKTLKNEFGIELQWYNKENYRDIDFMVKSIGLFYADKEISQKIENRFIEYLNSLKSTKNKIESK